MRLVDSRGRQVAAADAGEQFINTGRYFFEYTPEYSGVYYIVVSAVDAGGVTGGSFYALNVSGMAPVTLGAYRSASGMGFPAGAVAAGADPSSTTVSLNVLSGSVGTIRAGTHLVAGGNGETSADANINFSDDGFPQPDDRRADLSGGTFTVAGSLFEIYAGSDIETEGSPLVFEIGGDLGAIITGQSPIIGTGPTEGDLYARTSITFDVGGTIDYIDVSGTGGFDQDTDGLPGASPLGSITFRTGTAGGSGDIGIIRFGSIVASDAINVITAPGSTVLGFFVSQDVTDPIGPYVGIDSLVRTSGQGVNFSLGAGSDLRFFDTPNITNILGVDSQIDLVIGESVELIDDAGGRFTVEINGG
ncbi:Uncharacterized protein SCF082_LOCUS35610, partial [Durusdinium trenchii]